MATTYDIHFQLIPAADQVDAAGKVFSFGFVSAVGVKGPQKLVNRWLKCLLTPKGTDILYPLYGTGYADLIGSNVSNYSDFVDAVTMCVSDCNNQITALDQEQSPPDNERLQSAVISSVVPVEASGYDVYVVIKNAAGSLLSTQLPSGSTRP